MNKQEYDQYLQSEHWAKLKSAIRARDRGKCRICKSEDNLHVHHVRYREIYNVTKSDLILLCESCHDRVHIVFERNNTSWNHHTCKKTQTDLFKYMLKNDKSWMRKIQQAMSGRDLKKRLVTTPDNLLSKCIN